MNTYYLPEKTEDGKLPFQNKWYLILRMEQAGKDAKFNRKGVGKYVSSDYMGSAEFEFGAVPAAWKLYRAAANAGDLVISKSETRTLSGKPFWILHHKDYSVTDVDNAIVAAARGTTRLKESTYFDDFIGPVHLWSSSFDRATCFWMVMSTKFDYVCWGLEKDLVNKVLRELSQPEMSEPEVRSEPPKAVLPAATREELLQSREARDKAVSESLVMFETVVVNLPPKYNLGMVTATVAGIYEKHFDVKLKDGTKIKGLSYHALKATNV